MLFKKSKYAEESLVYVGAPGLVRIFFFCADIEEKILEVHFKYIQLGLSESGQHIHEYGLPKEPEFVGLSKDSTLLSLFIEVLEKHQKRSGDTLVEKKLFDDYRADMNNLYGEMKRKHKLTTKDLQNAVKVAIKTKKNIDELRSLTTIEEIAELNIIQIIDVLTRYYNNYNAGEPFKLCSICRKSIPPSIAERPNAKYCGLKCRRTAENVKRKFNRRMKEL